MFVNELLAVMNDCGKENTMPLISVIVPAYNVGLYIERCVESLLAQTYGNYELIIVNDGSTDNTWEILQKYKNESRINLITQENGGLSAARNTGISAATGSYLTFVDSDDWVDENYLAVLASASVKYDADIVSAGYVTTGDSSYHIVHNDEPVSYIQDKCADALFSLKETNFAWGRLIRKELICDGFFPVGRVYEDIGSMYRAYDLCKRLVIINGPYYYYFLRDGSITSTRKLNHVEDKLIFLGQMADYKLTQNYLYWDFYRLIKSFGAMSDLYKMNNPDKNVRKKLRREIYAHVKKCRLCMPGKGIKLNSNWVRTVLLKLRLAHIFLKFKNG